MLIILIAACYLDRGERSKKVLKFYNNPTYVRDDTIKLVTVELTNY